MPIKRNKVLQPLSRDHHQGLILAQILKKGAPEYKGLPTTIKGKKEYTISFYNSELIKHFKKEEEILFPFASGKNKELDEQINDIINDHQEISVIVEQVKNLKSVEETLDKLGRLLEEHIRKEERKFFPAIEKILTEGELSELETKLK